MTTTKMNKEEQFEEVILASERGTVFIKLTKDKEILLAMNRGHDIETLPSLWIGLTQRQIMTLTDILQEYCDIRNGLVEGGWVGPKDS